MKKPDLSNCTTVQFNKWYWAEVNIICKDCINDCKQSAVVQLQCKNFKKVEK